MDLSHYHCVECDADVYRGDEGWGCDCTVIPVAHLESGALDIPGFWADTTITPMDAKAQRLGFADAAELLRLFLRAEAQTDPEARAAFYFWKMKSGTKAELLKIFPHLAEKKP